MKGVSAPLSSLVIAICTYRQGLKSAAGAEQGEPRAAWTPRQHVRATAKRRASSRSPQPPGMAMAWHIHTSPLELVPFLLPRRAASRVTSELAAEV